MDITQLIQQLVRGLSLVGDAIVGLFQFLLGLVGLQIPEVYVRLSTIIVLILVIWKYSNMVSKVVLIALLFLLMSSISGFLKPLLSL